MFFKIKVMVLSLFHLLLLVLLGIIIYEVFEYKDGLINISENTQKWSSGYSIIDYLPIAAIVSVVCICISYYGNLKETKWSTWLFILVTIIAISVAIELGLMLKKIEEPYFLKSKYTHYYFVAIGAFFILFISLIIIYKKNFYLQKTTQ